MFLSKCESLLFNMALLLLMLLLVHTVGSQNSINPRRSKANFTNGVPSCPLDKDISHSTCKMSCLMDDDCANHGDNLKCCPSSPGSYCKAECRQAVLVPNGPKICYDFVHDAKYMIGDVFQRDGTCCQCTAGGVFNCSLSKPCTQGCYYESKYYKEGVKFTPNKCQNCSCRNGVIYCQYDTDCSREGKCLYKGKIYQPNHILRLDKGCKECVCESHGWDCNAITCQAESLVGSTASTAKFYGVLLLLQVLISGLLIS